MSTNKPWKKNIYTDLALEAHEIARGDSSEVNGVKLSVNKFRDNTIRQIWVEVQNEMGASAIGKPVGNYITIEADAMKQNDTLAHEEIIKLVAKAIGSIHKLKKNGTVLIVGLGNRNVTPDSLGPKVAESVLVTRHMVTENVLPKELHKNVRQIAAVAPGVLGITGIETAEIIKGIVDKIKPDLVIAIDALAARQTSRINATIQISDTGISPGGGMGNRRKGLNEETLGTKVIAIGVPTVVDAATLVNDTLDVMLGALIKEAIVGTDFYKMLVELEADEKYSLIRDVLNPYEGNMFVTPKEVDDVVERLSGIIANSLNIALNEGITCSDIWRYS